MNRIFIRLQNRLGADVGPVAQAKILGLAYRTLASYRAGTREPPLYVVRHIQALLLVPRDKLATLVATYAPTLERDEGGEL